MSPLTFPVGSAHDNIMFSLLGNTWDEEAGVDIGGSVIREGIRAHIQDLFNTPDAMIDGVRERDQSVRYRLVLPANPDFLESLAPGQTIRITHKMNSFTNAWYAVSGTEQYIIRYYNDIYANSSYISVGLTRKDKSGGY